MCRWSERFCSSAPSSFFDVSHRAAVAAAAAAAAAVAAVAATSLGWVISGRTASAVGRTSVVERLARWGSISGGRVAEKSLCAMSRSDRRRKHFRARSELAIMARGIRTPPVAMSAFLLFTTTFLLFTTTTLALDGTKPSTSMSGFGSSMLNLNDASILDRLKNLYAQKLRPLEKKSMYHELREPQLSDAWFDARPMVLLIGQYSVGKTSFIRYLLGRNFPNQHVGPEPTTDRFVAVMYGDREKVTPGNALTSQPDTPFHSLRHYGTHYLDKLEAAAVPAPILRRITLVDSPGVQAGEKQKGGRGYDFQEVIKWWAQHSDRILILFDPNKLDISDEFRSVIEELRPHQVSSSSSTQQQHAAAAAARATHNSRSSTQQQQQHTTAAAAALTTTLTTPFPVFTLSGQGARCLEQGGRGRASEAHARVRRANVELREHCRVAGGPARLHRLVLGRAVPGERHARLNGGGGGRSCSGARWPSGGQCDEQDQRDCAARAAGAGACAFDVVHARAGPLKVDGEEAGAGVGLLAGGHARVLHEDAEAAQPLAGRLPRLEAALRAAAHLRFQRLLQAVRRALKEAQAVERADGE